MLPDYIGLRTAATDSPVEQVNHVYTCTCTCTYKNVQSTCYILIQYIYIYMYMYMYVHAYVECTCTLYILHFEVHNVCGFHKLPWNHEN